MRIIRWTKSRKPSCSGPVLSRHVTLPHISHKRPRDFISSATLMQRYNCEAVDVQLQLAARRAPTRHRGIYYLVWPRMRLVATTGNRALEGGIDMWIGKNRCLHPSYPAWWSVTAILLDLDFIWILIAWRIREHAFERLTKLASGITGHRLTKYLFKSRREF